MYARHYFAWWSVSRVGSRLASFLRSVSFVTRRSPIYPRIDAIQKRVICPLIGSDKINPKNRYRITISSLASRTTRQERSINDYRSFPPFHLWPADPNAKREPIFPRFHQFFTRVSSPRPADASVRVSTDDAGSPLWKTLFSWTKRETIGSGWSKGNEKGTNVSLVDLERSR